MRRSPILSLIFVSVADRQTRQGIAIGNLTSQIFANIYLNEFDRFVRHALKPLGYVRYGDDFVLIMNTSAEAQHAQMIATEWLATTLHLRVHHTNNIVIPVKAGLHFLGHIIHMNSPLAVDRRMLRKIERIVCMCNIASYKAMALPRRFAQRMPWLATHNSEDTT